MVAAFIDSLPQEIANNFRTGCMITVAILNVYIISICYQAKVKFALKFEAQKKKERFLRYAGTDSRMVIADRLVGNHLEWVPVFLVLLWLNLMMTNTGTTTGWAYVGLRGLYSVLAANGGLGTSGPKNLILLSTVPAYGILYYYMYNILKAAI